MTSDPDREDDAARSPRSRRRSLRAASKALALAALATTASACMEQSHVLLELGMISSGTTHACAIARGALYCWGGQNNDGRLGVGDTYAHPSPTLVEMTTPPTQAEWRAVAAGEISTLALKVDGTIWTFGGNTEGQLGLDDVSLLTSPFQVGKGTHWTAIALRFRHACALDEDQSLWCWGDNGEGQLGQNDAKMADPARDHRPVPTQVMAGSRFTAVDTGQGHTCALGTDGTLWCWGRNTGFELGLGTNEREQFRGPTQVTTATDWTVVRTGQDMSCGVHGGIAVCWGLSGGQDVAAIPGTLFDPKVSTPVPMPKAIDTPPGMTDLSVHTFGGAAIDGKGGAWLWGRNLEGQLGLGDTEPHTGVVRDKGSGWTQVSVGRFATCGVREGHPVCAGKNDYGQLGQGGTSDSDIFVPVILPPQ